MPDFVTLFDKNYLSRGLALYQSLKNNCKAGFRLFILAMDSETEVYFRNEGLDNIVIETVEELCNEYPVLKELRKERTQGEFCWTLSSFSVQYTIKHFDLPSCTYLDSDLYFYNDPQLLLDGIGDKSVLITEHGYTPEYDQTVISGKFCVQFMFFKNDISGNEVLEWWRARCEEWCYNRIEDGKFGDQKYLDDWESRFEGHVLNCRHLGCGVAPWNCQRFEIIKDKANLYVQEKITKIKNPLVFIHFHGLIKMKDDVWIMTGYKMDDDIKELFKDYIDLIYEIEKKLPNTYVSKAYNEDPFKIRFKVWKAIKSAIKSFNKVCFQKPEYLSNIYEVR